MATVVSVLRRLPPGVRRVLKRLPGAAAVRDRLSGRPRIGGPAAGELRAVVYPPTWVEWDTMKQRPQHILQAFARAGHPVYFVDLATTEPREVDGVTIVPSLDSVPRDGVIVYAHFAPVRPMLRYFSDPVVVYDILDDLAIFDADEVGLPPERRVRHHHGPMIEDAAVVIGSSPLLVERHRSERADMLLIENGVETSRFAGVETPSVALDGNSPPIVGYHGMIARWFDFDLMLTVAGSMPEVTFVLVGPIDARCQRDASRLASTSNIAMIDELPSSEMPGIVAGFDVGIIPFVIDEMTSAVSPLKMYEYLAGGKPVVATPLPVCVDHPLVATAADPPEFVAAIRDALTTPTHSVAERRMAAAVADWDARLRPLLEDLDRRGLQRVPQ
ncbi:MAG: glycosyltransferase [Acidimicrobiia bacterium]